VVVRVNDDGIGFDPDDKRPDTIKPQGFGLFGIRVRFDVPGGRVDVQSSHEFGTSVSLYTPVSTQSKPKCQTLAHEI